MPTYDIHHPNLKDVYGLAEQAVHHIEIAMHLEPKGRPGTNVIRYDAIAEPGGSDNPPRQPAHSDQLI